MLECWFVYEWQCHNEAYYKQYRPIYSQCTKQFWSDTAMKLILYALPSIIKIRRQSIIWPIITHNTWFWKHTLQWPNTNIPIFWTGYIQITTLLMHNCPKFNIKLRPKTQRIYIRKLNHLCVIVCWIRALHSQVRIIFEACLEVAI